MIRYTHRMNHDPQPHSLARWSVHVYSLPYEREIRWANAVESAGLYALLCMQDSAGFCGMAEGTIKDTWSGVSADSLSAALRDLVMPRLASVDPGDPAQVAAALDPLVENRLARGLVLSASWTLHAARAGQALWQVWGGRDLVDLTWTLTRQAPERMAAEAAAVCERYGLRHLKVKGGQGAVLDRQALALIRDRVGDRVELTVDANGAYSMAAALDYLHMLADAGVVVAEDPCPLMPDRQFEHLQARSPLPILVDRQCASAADAALFLERGARALSAKPGRVGLFESRAIEALAAAQRARVAVGIYAESALGSLISLQQAAATDPALVLAAEQTFYLGLRAQVCHALPQIKDGALRLPCVPDLSSSVDWDAVQHYSVRPSLRFDVRTG